MSTGSYIQTKSGDEKYHGGNGELRLTSRQVRDACQNRQTGFTLERAVKANRKKRKGHKDKGKRPIFPGVPAHPRLRAWLFACD